MTDSCPWDTFPDTWRRTRLKYLVDGVDAGTWGEEPIAETDPFCVRAADFDRVRLRVSDSKLPRRHVAREERRRYRLAKGDIILEKSGGGAEAPVGLTVLFDLDVEAVCSNFASRIRPAEHVDPRYLNYVFAGLYFLGLTRRSLNQTTGIQNLDVHAWLHEPWAVPEFDAQRQLARELDRETSTIDELVDAKRRLRALLIEERAGIVEAGVAGAFANHERSASSIPWLPSMPAHWEAARLKYVARLGSGHTPSRQHPEWWKDCTVPWVTTGDVHRFRDDRLEVLDSTEQLVSRVGIANSSAEIHPSGTVVLSRTASVGFSAIMGSPMATSQDFATWTCGDRLLPEFLLYCLRAMRRDLLCRLAQGSTHQTIYMPDIERIMVPLPPPTEQRAIVDDIRRRLKPLDELVDAITSQLPKLGEYRRALVTEAVTGNRSRAA